VDEEDTLEKVVPLPLLPRWLKELSHRFPEPILPELLLPQWLVAGGPAGATRPRKVDLSLLLFDVTGTPEPVLIPPVIGLPPPARSRLRCAIEEAPFGASVGATLLIVGDTFVAGDFRISLVLGSMGWTLLVLGS